MLSLSSRFKQQWEATKLKYKLFSIIAAAAFFIVAGTNTHAEEIIVHKGDTLWDLSRKYDSSVESIKKWNHLTNDIIRPNDVLEVSPIKDLIIRKGDTLWDISQVYGVQVDDLMEWNQLTSDLIHPGNGLVIYTNLQEEATQTDSVTEQQSTEPTNEVTEESTAETAQPVTEPVEAAPAEPTTTEEPAEPAASSEPTGKEITVEATAYTAECEGCSGITKTGVDLKANPDEKVIAVDPSVIPLGSTVYVEGYGYAKAEDIGGGIKGHEIDVFVPAEDDALEWGRKEVKVTIID